jgi:hypothetical protein
VCKYQFYSLHFITTLLKTLFELATSHFFCNKIARATSIENLDDFAAVERPSESRDADVGRRLRPLQLVHLFGLVVQQDADEDDAGPEAGQEGDVVAEDEHRKPDQQHSLRRVGDTAITNRR